MRFVALALVLLGGLVSAGAQTGARHLQFDDGPAHNKSQVPGLLWQAIHSAHHAHYSGEKTVQFLHNGKSFSHEELVYRDGVKTRIEFPAGSHFAGQVIVEDANGRKHYFPDRNEVVVLPPRREESLDRLLRLVDRAKQGKVGLAVASGQRIAGLLTSQVVVSDESGNVTQRIYIEPKSGVVLKRELFEAGGSRWGAFEYSQVDLNPPPFDPSLFQFERRGVRTVTPKDLLRKLVVGKEFVGVSLPPSSGYLLEESRLDKIDGTPVLIESYVKKGETKEGSKLSVFEISGTVEPSQFARFSRNDFHAASIQKDGKTYVVVGSLGLDSLNQLAQSLN